MGRSAKGVVAALGEVGKAQCGDIAGVGGAACDADGLAPCAVGDDEGEGAGGGVGRGEDRCHGFGKEKGAGAFALGQRALVVGIAEIANAGLAGQNTGDHVAGVGGLAALLVVHEQEDAGVERKGEGLEFGAYAERRWKEAAFASGKAAGAHGDGSGHVAQE